MQMCCEIKITAEKFVEKNCFTIFFYLLMRKKNTFVFISLLSHDMCRLFYLFTFCHESPATVVTSHI